MTKIEIITENIFSCEKCDNPLYCNCGNIPKWKQTVKVKVSNIGVSEVVNIDSKTFIKSVK